MKTKPSTNRNASVKNYIQNLFAKEDPILSDIREKAKKEGLPNIHVSPDVGKLLYTLTKIHAPRRVLEIGTLAAISTIWIARALIPSAKLISLELDEMHARIARENIIHAGLENIVEIRTGNAEKLLDNLIQSNEGPFDLFFIDADKDSYPLYLEKILSLSRPGSIILSDNLIPREEVIGNPDPHDAEALAIYEFNQKIATHPQLESILVPTIKGGQGRIDGIGLSIVKSIA
jgi:predicted O-methyltransferase YrrM